MFFFFFFLFRLFIPRPSRLIESLWMPPLLATTRVMHGQVSEELAGTGHGFRSLLGSHIRRRTALIMKDGWSTKVNINSCIGGCSVFQPHVTELFTATQAHIQNRKHFHVVLDEADVWMDRHIVSYGGDNLFVAVILRNL